MQTTYFTFVVPVKVCRTFHAIGYTVTAVKEPMAVAWMWEENGISYIRVCTFSNWTNRALGIQICCDTWQFSWWM
jgi:hypothetical protein